MVFGPPVFVFSRMLSNYSVEDQRMHMGRALMSTHIWTSMNMIVGKGAILCYALLKKVRTLSASLPST